MKITRALAKAQRLDLWARPKSWRGTGTAVTVRVNGTIDSVPSSHGGFSWHPTVQDIADSWEIVSPKSVNQEYWSN